MPRISQAKTRVAKALQEHVGAFFDGRPTLAAKDLGITKQRFNSYTSSTSFPGAELIDTIKEKWELDLLNLDAEVHVRPGPAKTAPESNRHLPLFDDPVRLSNTGVQIVLKRKGAGVAVRVTISPNLKRA